MTLTNGRAALDAALLIAVTAISRFAFRSHYLYDIDSVNFALALRHYDPSVHQPHPPGYFLYICLGRLFNVVFNDANDAFVAIGIAFSCAAVLMIYLLAGEWFGRGAAIFASLVFVFSPLAWFHGTVALVYVAEAFFSALTGYLCWRAYAGSSRYAYLAAAAAGIGAGFRPSFLVLLAPLLLFSFRGLNRRGAFISAATLGASVAIWAWPMLAISGAGSYFSALGSLWGTVPGKGTLFNSSVANSVARACTIAGIYVLGFGCAAVLPWAGGRRPSVDDRRMITFTWVWLIPGLLFFTFIYLKFVNSGYLLVLVPPICVWMGLWGSRFIGGVRGPRSVRVLIAAVGAAMNTIIFIAAPVYCSYGAVRRFESELRDVIGTVRRLAPPRDTVIVGFDSHFLGYRHAGYYLPEYLTVEFPAVQLAEGRRIFAMKDGNTRLEQSVADPGVRSFLTFPLPEGDEYREYFANIQARFPVQNVRTIVEGGHLYVTGPLEDLRFLFPDSGGSTGELAYKP